MRVNPVEEQRWRAACYVLDELSAADRARFEADLANDEALADALVDVVELLQVSQAALSQMPAVPAQSAASRHERSRRWAVVTVAAASLLAVAAGGMVWWNAPSGPAPAHGVAALEPTDSAAELVARWRRSAFEEASVPTSDSEDEEMLMAWQEPLSIDDPIDADIPLETPSWLMAAVAGQYEQPANDQ